MAASTRCWLRPLTTTAAPDSASPRAMAKPIPAVDPVTMARVPLKSMIMAALRDDDAQHVGCSLPESKHASFLPLLQGKKRRAPFLVKNPC
jgi:hypothetical protein